MTFATDFSQFNSAQDNMDYDRLLAQRAQRIARLYEWPRAGITYPEKRPGDSVGWDYDSADRPTGGGILFHSPGSIVFSIVTPSALSNGVTIKSYLNQISTWITTALSASGYPTHLDSHYPEVVDTSYCATYYNPFEIRFDGEKVAALALRKWKSCLLVQGIIHVVSNYPYFNINPMYLSRGLDRDDLTAFQIKTELINHLNILNEPQLLHTEAPQQ
ncbi:lipoate--protein ligase family protein [bacterium]|nr:lipoate--protein ligase family protein [bacterium]